MNPFGERPPRVWLFVVLMTPLLWNVITRFLSDDIPIKVFLICPGSRSLWWKGQLFQTYLLLSKVVNDSIFCSLVEYKKARQEIKKKSSDTLKLQKKAKKGNYEFCGSVPWGKQRVLDFEAECASHTSLSAGLERTAAEAPCEFQSQGRLSLHSRPRQSCARRVPSPDLCFRNLTLANAYCTLWWNLYTFWKPWDHAQKTLCKCSIVTITEIMSFSPPSFTAYNLWNPLLRLGRVLEMAAKGARKESLLTGRFFLVFGRVGAP